MQRVYKSSVARPFLKAEMKVDRVIDRLFSHCEHRVRSFTFVSQLSRNRSLLSTSALDTFSNCGIWLSAVRRPRFSFRDLHADARRVKLFKCCPPHPSMKTPETQHHCDSSCASESIAFLKQENNFYTCSCNYFRASLFLWCLCEFQQVTHRFEYFFLNNSLPS